MKTDIVLLAENFHKTNRGRIKEAMRKRNEESV